MSYKRISPQPVVEGGTGAQTFTTHGVLVGEGTGAVVSTAAGTTGQVLTGSTGADPVWASPATSGTVTSISAGTGITLTPSPITSTGSVALTIPVVVSSGGTGAITLTGVLIGNGTSAVTGNAVTQHDVLVGGASNAITSVAPSAISGVPLISQGASSDPAFGTAVVAGGGTGDTSFTAYAVICGGTSSTGALQSIASVGSSGNVLTSNGAGALPTFQAAAGGGLSTASVTLTSSQVKNLVGTPITIVSAPGLGKMILVVSVEAQLNYGGTNAFTNPGTAPLALYYGAYTGSAASGSILAFAQITATASQIGLTSGSTQGASSTILNTAVVVSQNSGTNYAGNAAGDNTIVVQVWYLTITP